MLDNHHSDWQAIGEAAAREFEAWQERNRWSQVGKYEAHLIKKNGGYRKEIFFIYKNLDGDLSWSYGNKPQDRDPLPFTAGSISKETIDVLLVSLITGKNSIQIDPAAKIGNYASLLNRLLSDVRIH